MQTEFTIAIHLTRSDGAAVSEGWLADAELVFGDGALRGLSLVGFVIRRPSAHPQRQSAESPAVKVERDVEVAFPSRSYTTRDRKVRHYLFLRPTADSNNQEFEKLALKIYRAYLAAFIGQRLGHDDPTT